MRRILIYLFLFPTIIFSQIVEKTIDNFPKYQGIISYENKNNIFSEIKNILALNDFKIETENQILVTGNENFNYSQTVAKRTVYVGGVLSYNLNIELKENRIRYTLEITDVKAGLVSMMAILNEKPNDTVSVPILVEIEKFKNNFVEKLKLTETKNDNW